LRQLAAAMLSRERLGYIGDTVDDAADRRKPCTDCRHRKPDVA
jgi:hypothetical protein